MESKMSSEEDKYDVLEKIGHGSFGIIRKVRRKTDGMVVCRKEISYLRMSQKEREQLHAEFQILSTLRHPNIVGYYHREHLKATQDLHLYMEYCGNGDLGRTIRNLQNKNQLADEAFVWTIFSQILSALYRCHYGIDPPEVGKFTLGLGNNAKPKVPATGVTILHRDLKPENIFLGEDNSVKLGDFGLSKMIQSHDFASTYVGTPFYMSPEICAAEKYTLKSDVWSLGCIIYELCTREPPFNAKSHFQLVQKIKEGKVAPLPSVYSPQLFDMIKDCLKVNPDRRPDTATLLNMPIVRLMRKEKEVVDMGKILRTKEEAVARKLKDLDAKMAETEQDRVLARQEIDSSLRREWEVKARLEIDRHVQSEIETLQRRFEHEVQARVDAELAKQKTVTFVEPPHERAPSAASNGGGRYNGAVGGQDYPTSSIGTYGDGDFPSTTDLTELSIMESPVAPNEAKGRTPFGRAQTFAAPNLPGTPMDVEMASPVPTGPISISSLSLSPRRKAAAAAVSKARSANAATIFSQAQAGEWGMPRDPADMESDGEGEMGVNERYQQQQQNHRGRRAATAMANAHRRVVSSEEEREERRGRGNTVVEEDDEDEEMFMPSPTRMVLRTRRNPFGKAGTTVGITLGSGPSSSSGSASGASGSSAGSASTGLTAGSNGAAAPNGPRQCGGLFPRTKTAPVGGGNKGLAALPVPASKGALGMKGVPNIPPPSTSGVPDMGRAPLRERSCSPNRRLSKIPSAANLISTANANATAAAAGGAAGDHHHHVLVRKPSLKKDVEAGKIGPLGAGMGGRPRNGGVMGKNLVELHQARAGGRSAAGDRDVSPKRHGNGGPTFRERLAASEPAAVWDPEVDDMPSPFLSRRTGRGFGILRP